MLLEADKKVIGKKFKEYRKSKRMTQFELAEKVGLNEKQISRIEMGLNYPTYPTFIKLIEVLDINVTDFVLNAPISANPLKDELNYIIKNADDTELKLFINVLKTLKKNLELIK